MSKPQITELSSRMRGRLVLLAAFLFLLYVVVPRIGNFSDSFDAILNARFGYVTCAFLAMAMSFVMAAGVYQCLTVKRLYYRRTLLVQVANAFANRLLPAGLGGLTLSVQYLRRSGHTLAQALVVAGTNNLLGLAGHLIILAFALIVTGGNILDKLELPHIPGFTWITLAVIVALAANLLAFQRIRRYVYRLSLSIAKQIAMYRLYPRQLAAALLLSVGLTCSYALALYFCGLAVDAGLGLGSMFVVFTFGVIATAATPTPGGLGGAEAGLVAAMVAYDVDSSSALACVLLYRFLTYWLPLLPGFAVFVAVRKRYLEV